MEALKKTIELLQQIKFRYRDIQSLSRWKRDDETDELSRINDILKKRSDILLEIDDLNNRLAPLRHELKNLPLSEVLHHILNDNYQDLENLIQKIREEDTLLMKRLGKKIEKIKQDLGGLNRQAFAARQYATSAAGAY